MLAVLNLNLSESAATKIMSLQSLTHDSGSGQTVLPLHQGMFDIVVYALVKNSAAELAIQLSG